jgi:hypothetical protein
VSERRFGRADISSISSANVVAAQPLADELVYVGVQGRKPLQFRTLNVDNATLLVMLTTPLQRVFTITDTFGGTTGDARHPAGQSHDRLRNITKPNTS